MIIFASNNQYLFYMGNYMRFRTLKGINYFLGLILLSFIAISVNSQETEVIYTDHLYPPGFEIQNQGQDGVEITFSINKFYFTEKNINKEILTAVNLPGNILPNNYGAPDLPGSGKYIAMPVGAQASLNIKSFRTESYLNIDVAPAPRIPKETETGPLDYQRDMSIYSKNEFYPANPIMISAPMKIRGVDVVMLGITPFQYNPVTKELLVYRDIEVEVNFIGGNGQFGDNRLRNRWWDAIIKDAVFNASSLPKANYSSNNSKIQSDTNNFEYVIICPDDPVFIQWADTIRIWRTRQGILSGVVPLSQIGGNNTGAIESFIDHAYNSWTIPPAAILFLGDYGTTGTDCIISPEWNNYCISDNLYADVDGDDLPDISTARITARDAAELEHMIGKFLSYERNPPTNPGFYDNPITAMGWQTERWFQLCSEIVNGFWEYGLGKNPIRENAIYQGTPGTIWSSNTNTPIIIDYFGTQGLNYIPDNTSHLTDWGGDANRINNDINNGAFMLMHRDHGSVSGWGEPSYSTSDLPGLTNNDLIYVLSINCLTGKFNDGSESFAEAFHRHQYGALGIMAATEVSYSFVNDTYVWGLVDDMWPEFMPAYGAPPGHSDNILPAFANSAGKYFLQQSSWPYNPQNKEVTYYLFHHHGDAFSTVYSEIPQYLTVVHNPILYSGVSFFNVTADTGALISLTVNDEIIGVDFATGGPLNIQIPPQMPGNNMLITITKQNYYRYTMMVPIIPPVGPFVIYSSHITDDTTGGNSNGLVEFGENIDLSLSMVNLGVQLATNVNVIISTTDTNVFISDSTEFYGNINAGDTALLINGFSFGVNNLIPDDHNVLFNVKAIGDSIWNSSFTLKIFSPLLSIGSMVISDPSGNNNGRLDPGETVDLLINTSNIGHSDASNTQGILSSTHPAITVNTPSINIGTINAGNSVNAVYNITVDPTTPTGTVVDLHNFVYSGPYADTKTFYQDVGLIVEDWESGDFTKFNWGFDGTTPWVIDSNNQYEGNYCSRSGDIPNNASSVLSVMLEVLLKDSISFYRKVSSEASYDYLKFYIDGNLVDQWSGELTWARVSYPVDTGFHTFSWEYVKDYMVNSGSDCAWVDFIVLPPINIPANDAGITKIYNIPGQSGVHNIYVDIKNFGLDTLVSATIDWEVDGNPGAGFFWSGSLPKDGVDGPVMIGNYNFTNGWHTIRAWTTNPNGSIDDFNFNDTTETSLFFISPVNTYPYCESFENGIGLWQQPSNDDFDWTQNIGPTQSNSTGPSGAYDGNYYMYTEASQPRVNGDEAFFDCEFDFTTLNNPELSFYCHMWGQDMGTLHVDIFDSVWNNDYWSLSGDQGNSWFYVTINLSAFANKPFIKIRFRGEIGNGGNSTYRSDISIDLVCVSEIVPVYCIPYSGCTTGDGIEDFTLNTIVHLGSGCSPGGYGDFTNMMTDLITGSTYPVSASSNYDNQYLSLWIDLDDNYNFDNNERLLTDLHLINAGNTYSDNIIVPLTATYGQHRMRVRARWNQTCINPCDTFTYGETHDYMVNLIPDTTLIVNIYPDTSLCQGDSVLLTAGVIGSGAPFFYLWNDGNTSPSILVSPNNTTAYSVTVTDSYSNTANDDVTINVFPPPHIVSHPVDVSVKLGGTVKFGITDNGGMSYQWQVSTNSGLTWTNISNNMTYSGATTDSLTITNVQMSLNDYYYRCVVSNANLCTDISDAGKLTVIFVPTILTEAVSYTGCMGNISVPLNVDNFIDVSGFVLSFSYDVTHLTYAGYQNLNPMLGSVNINNNSGQVEIYWNNITNITLGDETIIEILFNCISGSSVINFDLATCNYYDQTGYSYPDDYLNGAITTYICSSVSGQFFYPNQDTTPLSNTILYAENINGWIQDTSGTDNNGDYFFTSLPLGSYSLIADINKTWGGVNANDALMIMMHFANMTTLTGLPLLCGDVDHSGFVNTVDALMCAQRFVGMINSFPSGDWANEIDTLVVDGTTPLVYNFKGLCFGDVNRSYLPPNVKVEPLLSLETKGVMEMTDDRDLIIPLSVNKDMAINAISLILNYPCKTFDLKSVEINSDHGILNYNIINDELRISWYSVESLWIQEDDILLNLIFNKVSNNTESCSFKLNGLSELADEAVRTIENAKLYIPELISAGDINNGGEFYLGQNFPNPFSRTTEIEYSLYEKGKVSLMIYNSLGEKVITVMDNILQDKGTYNVNIDATQLSKGIYYYRMTFGSESGIIGKTRSMVIISE